MRNSLKALLVVFGAVVLSVGCEPLQRNGIAFGKKVPYNPQAVQDQTPLARENIQFADIPIPRGFWIDRENSFSFQGNSFRLGTFTYIGVGTFMNTARFFDSQMKESGWEQVRSVQHDDFSATGFFEKGRERCEIYVNSKVEHVEVQVRLNTISDSKTLALRSQY